MQSQIAPVSFPVAKVPPPVSDYKPVALAGYLLILFCFGGLGLWAGLAKLGSSIQASGTISVATQRKVIEHLEGGLVKTINVHEGQLVRAGDLLVRFSDVQTAANLDVARDGFAQLKGQEARLLAERDRLPRIAFPLELLVKAKFDPEFQKALDDQTALFLDRRQSLDSQTTILNSRAKGLSDEIEGLDRERDSARQQLSLIDDELAGVRDLFNKGLVPRARRNALEREKARIDGIIGRGEADAAKATNSVAEIQLQINQINHRFTEEVANSLQETRQKMVEIHDKIAVYVDAQKRSDIIAPASGYVQNLKVSTVGQVARAGETLMEIVPPDDPLVVQAQVSPSDVTDVHEDMPVEIKFPSFHSRLTPLVLGKVGSMSRAEFVNEATHSTYFLARIAIADTDIPPELKGNLRAGMQAEVIFPTGNRSVLQYLVHPLTEALGRTFKEK